MSVSSLCAVCESREADHTCERCGRGVCSQHYDEAFGLCMDCSESASGETRRGQPDGPGEGDAGEGDVRF